MKQSKAAVDDGVDGVGLIRASQTSPCTDAENAKNEAPFTGGGRSAEVNQRDGETIAG